MRMANGPNNRAVEGTTYVTETVVRAQWAWMSLPFIVEALILLYLLGMMISSGGMPTWKDQTFATLCHGLDQKTIADVTALQVLFRLIARLTFCCIHHENLRKRNPEVQT